MKVESDENHWLVRVKLVNSTKELNIFKSYDDSFLSKDLTEKNSKGVIHMVAVNFVSRINLLKICPLHEANGIFPDSVSVVMVISVVGITEMDISER